MGILFDNKKETFEFNLLRKASNEELSEAQKRKQNIINLALIPVVALVLGIMLFIIDSFALARQLNTIETRSTQVQTSLANPNNDPTGPLKSTNGELILKTDLIATPVEKNVEFNVIFEAIDDVFSEVTSAEPTSYGRESDGDFEVFAVARRESAPSEVLVRFQNLPTVRSADLRSVEYDVQDNNYKFVIGFLLVQNDTTSNLDSAVAN